MKQTQTKVILFSAIFFTLFDNFIFFSKTYEVFQNIPFMIGIGIVLTSVMVLLFSLILNKWTLKPILIILFISSGAVSYFMQAYGVVIDDKMLQNMLETDTKEAGDLLNITLFIYIFLLGIIPSIILYKTKIIYQPLKKEIIDRLKYIIGSMIIIFITLFIFSKTFTSFFREHKPLRYYTNPTFYIYNIGKFINQRYIKKPLPFKKIGVDAKLKNTKQQKLIIFVLGEAARYDHFGLNGYERDTTPLVSKENIINFPKLYSCGTETAVSVPCMFSPYDRTEYKDAKAKSTESVIDVLNRAGVNILWRDNDSGDKKVASRIKFYQDFNHDNNSKYCTKKDGCLDDVLFVGLQKWIDEVNNSKPIFIVLHTKGSHGPAYYKRYPKKFEKFKPVCKTNQLQNCKQQEVVNGYDNTILYTDYILDKTIKFLKKNENKYAVGMYYMADHGESLGENGIYLHGYPYFIAPEAQKHPASIAWFGENFGINIECMKKEAKNRFSHDNLFSTILGLVGVDTKIYNPKKDIFKKCYNNEKKE